MSFNTKTKEIPNDQTQISQIEISEKASAINEIPILNEDRNFQSKNVEHLKNNEKSVGYDEPAIKDLSKTDQCVEIKRVIKLSN